VVGNPGGILRKSGAESPVIYLERLPGRSAEAVRHTKSGRDPWKCGIEYPLPLVCSGYFRWRDSASASHPRRSFSEGMLDK
jgi:hypothetical protein